MSTNQVAHMSTIAKKQGIEGSLGVDDVDGYGPENYVAANIQHGTVFKALVHCFPLHSDSSSNWTLTARVGGSISLGMES